MSVEIFLTALRDDVAEITGKNVAVGRTEEHGEHIGIDYLGSTLSEPTICLDHHAQVTTFVVSFRVYAYSYLESIRLADLIEAAYSSTRGDIQGVKNQLSTLISYNTVDLQDSRRYLTVCDYNFIV